jgi:hypothetical protein
MAYLGSGGCRGRSPGARQFSLIESGSEINPPSRCLNFQLHANFFLKGPQDGKEVRGARVPVWAQHAMQALAWDSHDGCQPLEANSGIDKIFEDRFANCFFAAEVSIDRFRQQGLSE